MDITQVPISANTSLSLILFVSPFSQNILIKNDPNKPTGDLILWLKSNLCINARLLISFTMEKEIAGLSLLRGGILTNEARTCFSPSAMSLENQDQM